MYNIEIRQIWAGAVFPRSLIIEIQIGIFL